MRNYESGMRNGDLGIAAIGMGEMSRLGRGERTAGRSKRLI